MQRRASLSRCMEFTFQLPAMWVAWLVVGRAVGSIFETGDVILRERDGDDGGAWVLLCLVMLQGFLEFLAEGSNGGATTETAEKNRKMARTRALLNGGEHRVLKVLRNLKPPVVPRETQPPVYLRIKDAWVGPSPREWTLDVCLCPSWLSSLIIITAAWVAHSVKGVVVARGVKYCRRPQKMPVFWGI